MSKAFSFSFDLTPKRNELKCVLFKISVKLILFVKLKKLHLNI